LFHSGVSVSNAAVLKFEWPARICGAGGLTGQADGSVDLRDQFRFLDN